MAYIGHRCACGHSGLEHGTVGVGGTRRRACNAGGGCRKRCRHQDAPELLPTFDEKGRRIERVVPPGEGFATAAGTATPKTCACDACKALYTELTGAEPEPVA